MARWDERGGDWSVVIRGFILLWLCALAAPNCQACGLPHFWPPMLWLHVASSLCPGPLVWQCWLL
jgi:hypothetical protein